MNDPKGGIKMCARKSCGLTYVSTVFIDFFVEEVSSAAGFNMSIKHLYSSLFHSNQRLAFFDHQDSSQSTAV